LNGGVLSKCARGNSQQALSRAVGNEGRDDQMFANDRLLKTSPGIDRVLTAQNGAVISNPSTILLLGRDFANTDQRVADNHSDSIMILRTDPDHQQGDTARIFQRR